MCVRSLARSAHEAGKALLSMMALLPGRRTWQVFFLTVLSKASHALCILRAPQMRAKKAHDNGAASRKAIDRRLLGGKGEGGYTQAPFSIISLWHPLLFASCSICLPFLCSRPPGNTSQVIQRRESLPALQNPLKRYAVKGPLSVCRGGSLQLQQRRVRAVQSTPLTSETCTLFQYRI